MSVKNHIHKYFRVRDGKNGSIIWRCADCTHFVRNSLIHFRDSRCWSCNGKFQMAAPAIYRKKPKCPLCRGVKPPEVKVSDIERLDNLLEKFGIKDVI